MLESHWGRCEVWTQANMNCIMKNYSGQCQQSQDIQARKAVPFPAGLRMFVPGQGFGAAFVPRSFRQKHLQRGGHKRTSKHQWNGYCQHLSIQWTRKTPQMYLLHSKGHLLGQYCSKRLGPSLQDFQPNIAAPLPDESGYTSYIRWAISGEI